MSDRLYRSLQSLLLVLLGLFLLDKIIDGSAFWYINARFLPLTLFGAVGLILLARVGLDGLRKSETPPGLTVSRTALTSSDAHAGHAHGSALTLLALAVPLLLGVLVPARPLGASAIDHKGFSVVAPQQAASSHEPLQTEISPADRTVLDWIRAFNQAPDATVYQDQPADLVGFVYHDPRLPPGQFLLARFTLTCCVADASAIGVIVEWAEADALPTNAWLRVRGPVSSGELEGHRIPLIQAESLESIAVPTQPYLYN